MKELKVFNGMEVEFVVVNDKVLFGARCVGEILGIVDVNSVIRNFNDKQIVKLKNSDVQDMQFRKLNNAGENFLTESGVYKLVMRSNKPEAEQFQDWVTDDLLPTIRKTGGYVVENRAIDFVSNWLPNLDDTSKNVIAGMLEDNQKLRLENSKQKEIIEIQTPKAEYFDALVETNLLTSFRDTAKEFKVKETKFIEFLLEKKYIFRDKRNKLKPSAQYVGDLFELKEFTKGNYSDVQTRITPRGREIFRLLVDKLLQ